MRSLSVLLLSLCSCGAALQTAVWEEAEPGAWLTGPYLISAGQGAVIVAGRKNVADPPVVEWWLADDVPAGEVPGAPRRETMRRRDDLWAVKLTGLPEGPTIAYRVTSGSEPTPIYSFRAGQPPGARFRFVVFGDTRTNHIVHRDVIERAAAEDLDFVVHTGDMVDHGGIVSQWTRFFQIARPLFATRPVIPAFGNHDEGMRDYFRHYFQHEQASGGSPYFARDWGHVRVVVVTREIKCGKGCPEYDRVEQLLREGAERGMLMVLAMHHPPYSSGEHGSDMGVRRAVAGLARRYGVELVIAGHDHDYERTNPIDGTTYIVSGSAGAPIREVQPHAFSATVRTEPHYVLIDVEKDRLFLRAVNLQGNTFDSTVIPANPPGR